MDDFSFLDGASSGTTMLLVGPSGVGKTGSLITLINGCNPRTGNPWRIRLFDFDNGAAVLASLLSPEQKKAAFGRVFVQTKELRDPPNVSTQAKPNILPANTAAHKALRFLGAWPQVRDASGAPLTLPSLADSTDDDIIIVDGLTKLSEACNLLARTIVPLTKEGNVEPRQVFYEAQNKLSMFMSAFFAPSKAHRILLAHGALQDDGSHGMMLPGAGKKYSPRILLECNVALYAEPAQLGAKEPQLICRPPFSKFTALKSPVAASLLPAAIPLYSSGLQSYFEALLGNIRWKPAVQQAQEQ